MYIYKLNHFAVHLKLCDLRDLSSLTRDRTWALGWERVES